MYRCFDELDRDNTVAWLNRSLREISGIDSEAVYGIDAGDFVTRHLATCFEDEGSAGRVVEALRCRGEVPRVTCRVQTRAGDLHRFSFSCRVMTGEPYAGMMLARFRDVTPEHDEAAEVRPGLVYASIGELIPYGT